MGYPSSLSYRLPALVFPAWFPFWRCLTITGLCKCEGLVPSLQTCAGTRCSGDRNQTIQTFVDTILCPKPKPSTTSTPRTSTTSSRSGLSSSMTTPIITPNSIVTTTSRTVPSSPTPTCPQYLHGNGTRRESNCLITGGADVVKQELGLIVAVVVLAGCVHGWIGV